ncbi:tRNA (N6-threonylcarbamoyladenosine(37)-N6)-methyltransferase TrmO [Desulfovibrio inopinatus]|uniref:tRNA (N6-threonylcarbamoyladenosine(37)-N6)-methyltransferase TrmO n=1 Tax=Desulfovibrio inopinatus TaxID=102109 RepID=UPI000417E679|nr:tRNA (N6-threonylcarbamoyladenosine(37)-N6)-methyltransferase TrmO [Desulfovibrio inopinatus]
MSETDSNIVFSPIGFVESPHVKLEGMPIQPRGAKGIQGRLILDPELAQGLHDLDGFSHIIVLYYFHKSEGYDLLVKPFLDTATHGVFATRAPRRPNPLGLSILRVIDVTDNIVTVEDIDIHNGTPIIDIKPYVAAFDDCKADCFGWMDGKKEEVREARSDSRFVSPQE